MVQLSGAVVWLALVAGLALGGPGGQGQDQCASQCQQVYSLNTGQYEQVGRWHWHWYWHWQGKWGGHRPRSNNH